ncbi:MAG: hypothetical protein EXS55_00455 [Candidatus Magasanikbacteria bacterium]|nr:hypothetical protein [Candidatus Magasanikbacteria bacterium]
MSKPFPRAIPLARLLGPSFIILALGLGSGEIILWPYLASNYGLGLVWAAILGISCQFFINMEIERYALIKGESVFVGLNKIFPWAPYWFIISTFVGFGLPGIIAAAAQAFAAIFGIAQFKWLAMLLLVLVGTILSVGKTVYATMEKITKIVLLLGVPFILILAVLVSQPSAWTELATGLIGRGKNFSWFPAGISLATFLAAFAYSGAGGNLNLTQSIYIKEKGYGMGRYAQKISGLFTNLKQTQTIKLTGEHFTLNPENIKQFRVWWRRINLEHLIIFWFVGSLAMGLLMLLAYSTAYGLPDNTTGIHFVINEGIIIGQKIAPLVGSLFLLVVSIMLFQTQLGVLDSTSRIMAENYALKKLGADETGSINLSKIYFVFLWAQIAFGIILFLLNIYEPKTLIILGAILNAMAMTVHIALVNIMNYKLLPKALQPRLARRIVIIVIFCIFAGFSLFTIGEKIL